MVELLNTGLSWIGDMLGAALMALAGFVLGFFPDADPAVNAAIDAWDAGGGELTLNVLYFVDMPVVMVCAGLAVGVVFVCLLVSFVRWVVSVAHDVIDSIPVIG